MMSLLTMGSPRRLLVIAVFGGLVITGAAGRAPVIAAGTRVAMAGPTVHLPEPETRHYSQGADGLDHIQIYNAPVGQENQGGWTFRDPVLHALPSNGKFAPSTLPFQVQVEPASDGSALASLTNEDGVTLNVGLARGANAPPLVTIAGQLDSNAVTFPGLAGAGADVAIRSTVSGLDVRVTLHSANASGPVTLALTPDPRATLTQDASGAIMATRPISACGSTGCLPDIQQPEYILGSPVLHDSSTNAAAQGFTGPVTLALTPPAAGPRQLTITIDPAWT